MDLYLAAFLVWILFVPIAILNGYVREEVYRTAVGELRAHQISTVVAMAMFMAVAALVFWPLLPGVTLTQAWLAGAMMVALTVGFEFGFGRLIRHLDWSTLVQDYNLKAGRLWSLFLVVMALAPVILRQLQAALSA